MDPNAVLANMLDALAAGEEGRGDAIECMEDLLQWLKRGGFVPNPSKES